MKTIKIAEENRTFLCVDIGLTICQSIFVSTILSSQTSKSPPTFMVKHYGEKTGCLIIDTSELQGSGKEEILREFLAEVKNGVCAAVSTKISDELRGEMRDNVTILNGKYKFNFKISEYDRDEAHKNEKVMDFLPLPENEKLCRIATLKITLA